jgi:inosose dehydratase
VKHAQFVRDVGGLYLQVVDQRPRDRAAGTDDYTRMGRLLTELGRRTADLGVPLGLHNHMGNLRQAPDEVARVLDAADPRYVRLELDTAHYAQAGGDPATAVERYRDRLLFLHVKDLESPVPGRPADSYRFVELGRGKVDFPAFFAALARERFEGWAIVELDRVPEAGRTPKESGEIARRYLESKGFTL